MPVAATGEDAIGVEDLFLPALRRALRVADLLGASESAAPYVAQTFPTDCARNVDLASANNDAAALADASACRISRTASRTKGEPCGPEALYNNAAPKPAVA